MSYLLQEYFGNDFGDEDLFEYQESDDGYETDEREEIKEDEEENKYGTHELESPMNRVSVQELLELKEKQQKREQQNNKRKKKRKKKRKDEGGIKQEEIDAILIEEIEKKKRKREEILKATAARVHYKLQVKESVRHRTEWRSCVGWKFCEKRVITNYSRHFNSVANYPTSLNIPYDELIHIMLDEPNISNITKSKLQHLKDHPKRVAPYETRKSNITAEAAFSFSGAYESVRIGKNYYCIGKNPLNKNRPALLVLDFENKTGVRYTNFKTWYSSEIENDIYLNDFKIFPTTFKGKKSIMIIGGIWKNRWRRSNSQGMEVFILGGVDNEYELGWAQMGTRTNFYSRLFNFASSVNIPFLKGYTVSTLSNKYMIVGGRSNSFNKNIINLTLNQYGLQMTTKPIDSTYHAPEPRVNHGACSLRDAHYIYGGYNEKGVFCNTMHCFVESTNKWTQIDVKGAIPPIMKQHCSVNLNNSIVIYTAKIQPDDKSYINPPQKYAHNEHINAIYTFSVKEQKWHYVAYPKTSRHAFSPSQHHLFMHKGDSLVFGHHSDKFGVATFQNLIYPGRSPQRFETFYRMACEKKVTDVCFRVYYLNPMTNEEELLDLHAHACIVKCRFPALGEEIDESYDNILDFTHIHHDVMVAFIKYIYTGSLELSHSIPQLMELGKKYSPSHHERFFARMCSLEPLTLHWTRLIYDDLHQAYDSLRFSPDADFELFNDEGHVVPCHRFALCRLPTFLAMFASDLGFRETLDGRANIDLSSPLIDVLLQYLYCDEFVVDPSNVIEFLKFSLSQSLTDISSYCRSIVKTCLTPQNALDVYEIAVAFNDNVLKSVVLIYLNTADNYATIRLTSRFQEPVFESLRQKCEARYTKNLSRLLKQQ